MRVAVVSVKPVFSRTRFSILLLTHTKVFLNTEFFPLRASFSIRSLRHSVSHYVTSLFPTRPDRDLTCSSGHLLLSIAWAESLRGSLRDNPFPGRHVWFPFGWFSAMCRSGTLEKRDTCYHGQWISSSAQLSINGEFPGHLPPRLGDPAPAPPGGFVANTCFERTGSFLPDVGAQHPERWEVEEDSFSWFPEFLCIINFLNEKKNSCACRDQLESLMAI